MKLKRIGYYKEMPHGDDTDPSIMDCIQKKVEHKNEICRYLQSGYTLAACGSVVMDVISPEKGIIGSPDDVTDGTWMWPADLVYYIQNNNLELPKEFIATMKENNWEIKQALNDIDFEEIEVDGFKVSEDN